jgi:hypothetical protein
MPHAGQSAKNRRRVRSESLDHPEFPLPTNETENDIRCQVTKRKISGGTRSDVRRDCRDGFLSRSKHARNSALPSGIISFSPRHRRCTRHTPLGRGRPPPMRFRLTSGHVDHLLPVGAPGSHTGYPGASCRRSAATATNYAHLATIWNKYLILLGYNASIRTSYQPVS